MEKDQIIELRIEDMLDEGRAFGRYDGCAVFVSAGGGFDSDTGMVKSAIPGDLVQARVTKTKKSSAEAEAVRLTEASPDRVKAECPYFGECGGCTLQELSYDAQKRLKTEQVRAKLERLGGLEAPKVNEMVGAETLKYYRNKATFAVGPHGEVGFMKGRSHFVMDIEDCMLQSDAAMVCADALRSFLKMYASEGQTGRNGSAGKNKRNKKKPVSGAPLGITQMIVRTAFSTGEVLVALESEKKDIPHIGELVQMLDDAVYSLNEMGDAEPEASELSEASQVSFALESVNVIYGGDPKTGKPGKCVNIAGKPTVTEEVKTDDGRRLLFEISPQSFYQVNPEQMVRLYDKAAEYAGLLEEESAVSGYDKAGDSGEGKKQKTVLDLYCGIGTIGLWMAEAARHSAASNADDSGRGAEDVSGESLRVIGIESVKPAVIDANRNSVINGFVNTRYFCGKAEEELPGMMGLTKLYKWNEVNERVEREPEIKIAKNDKSSDEHSAEGGTSGDAVKRSGANAPVMYIDRVDVAIVDPPRAGCGEALLAAVAAAQPGRIVYVSCDPGTLARDIKYLTAHGYEFIEATPVDQFPHTSHIETVCLLGRRKPDDTIKVSVNMDDYYQIRDAEEAEKTPS
ncbi:MAG: class I SAM-dependent RNA methyltransferase [Mogibacterium sp.]|nr:class I SAM-dependent RNA methyltransferase [Mogibacterium sp.]